MREENGQRESKFRFFLRQIIKFFLPPILIPKNINEIYSYFKRGEDKIKYENSFYTRHAFVNKSLRNFNNPSYLEIGVQSNDLFNSIPLKLSNKYGVDPETGGNFRMTSDKFFSEYTNIKFHTIFIDGLHHYEQVQKDAINSIKHLNKNGIIFFHDMLPRNEFEEYVPRKQSSWTGDVWKVAVELMNSPNCIFKIANIDMGIGILKILDNFQYIKMPELKDKRYDDFLKYYPKFDIINSEQALDFIEFD
jgi:hypothetical protein